MTHFVEEVLDLVEQCIHNIVDVYIVVNKQRKELNELKKRVETLEKVLCNSSKNVV